MLETLDNGKPIKESRDVDVPTAAAHFFYHAGLGRQAAARRVRAGPARARRGRPGHPVELPAADGAWKIAPALAAGNTVVIKPAETTPLSLLVLAEIMPTPTCRRAWSTSLHRRRRHRRRAGRAPRHRQGRVHRVHRGRQADPDRAGRHRPRLTLELGGKAANIVFDDAAVDQAVEGIVNGIFFNQGHVCCAGSRLLVQESVADEFLDRLRARVETLRVGDPLDKNTDVGAINSRAQLDKITALTAVR